MDGHYQAKKQERYRMKYFDSKQYYQNNKEKILAQNKIWRDKHPKEMRKLIVNWVKSHPWYISYRQARQRCLINGCYSSKGIKFHMTILDFKYLWFRDKAYLMKKPSIDRKDNFGHYTIENCRFIELKDNQLGKTRIGWVKYHSCINCHTTVHKHYAKNRCKTCYQIYYRKNKKCGILVN